MTFAYEGDRNRDDIVSFAKRLLGPPVGELRTKGDFEEAKTKSEIFFVFTGEQEGPLWDTFYQVPTRQILSRVMLYQMQKCNTFTLEQNL